MANANITISRDKKIKKQAAGENSIPSQNTSDNVVVASNEVVASVSKQLLEQNKTAYEELAK